MRSEAPVHDASVQNIRVLLALPRQRLLPPPPRPTHRPDALATVLGDYTTQTDPDFHFSLRTIDPHRTPDERHARWGIENPAPVIRPVHAGFMYKNGHFHAPPFRLWHRENDHCRLGRILNSELVRAECGLDHCVDGAAVIA